MLVHLISSEGCLSGTVDERHNAAGSGSLWLLVDVLS